MTNGMIDTFVNATLGTCMFKPRDVDIFFGVWHNLCSEFLLDG